MVNKYLLRVAQTLEGKWRKDIDYFTSDTVANAPADDNAVAHQPPTDKQLLERLRDVLKRAGNFLPSQYKAQQIFSNIAAAKQKNQVESNPYYQEAQRILIQLDYLGNRLPQGMTELGVKPNAIPILKQNIQTLMDGQNFGAYQHYTLVPYGEAPIIDLDEWQAQNKPDLGF